MTFAAARAHAGGADATRVLSLIAALEDAGILEAIIESPTAVPRVVRRASKR
jgi:hypothetical protein